MNLKSDDIVVIKIFNDRGEPFTIENTFAENGRTYACVRFLNTGTTDIFRMDAVKKGQIKDRYSKIVFGVACIGKVKKVGNEKEYGIWNKMIERCYVEKSKSYNNYGGKGIKVCDRWLCFEYFLKDIKMIDGYNEEMFIKDDLHLDKDIKQHNITNKIYSLETCTFVSIKENNNHRNISNIRKIRAIGYKDDNIVYIDNILKFAKEYQMSNSGIYECLSGKKSYHNGWRFERWI